MSDDSAPEYWFDTSTGQVEVGRRKPSATLMGPYATREQAARALATARERTEAWDRAEAAEDD